MQTMRPPHLVARLPGQHLPGLHQLESIEKEIGMNPYDDEFMDDDEKDLKTLMGMIMRRKLIENQVKNANDSDDLRRDN